MGYLTSGELRHRRRFAHASAMPLMSCGAISGGGLLGLYDDEPIQESTHRIITVYECEYCGRQSHETWNLCEGCGAPFRFHRQTTLSGGG